MKCHTISYPFFINTLGSGGLAEIRRDRVNPVTENVAQPSCRRIPQHPPWDYKLDSRGRLSYVLMLRGDPEGVRGPYQRPWFKVRRRNHEIRRASASASAHHPAPQVMVMAVDGRP